MKVLALPDRHFPWADRKVLPWVVAEARRIKPDAIVGLGDGLDLYSFSPYPRSYNLMTPAQEVKAGLRQYADLWSALRAAAPGADCYEIDSNHGARLRKRVLEKLPEFESLFSDPFAVPGVETRERVVLQGVMYEHGFRAQARDHARHNLQSTVHGHTHGASLVMLNLGGRPRFNLECGWLGDRNAPVFKYKSAAVDNWTHALGLVDDGEPRLLFPAKQRRAA